MRTATIQKTIYTFDELQGAAKDKARESVFEFIDEYTLDDFKTIAELLGFYDVKPRYSGFWCQGDGASFTGRYSYAKGAAKAIRQYAPQDKELHRIADGLQAVQRRNFYRLSAVLSLGNNSNYYAHENTIAVEVDNGEDWATDGAADDVSTLCRDLMRWLYRTLESDYEYQSSDDAISETCAANGYEFTADGRFFRGE